MSTAPLKEAIPIEIVDWPKLAETIANPYPYYDELLAAGPIARAQNADTLVVTGHAEASALLRHPSVRSADFALRLSGAAENWQQAAVRLRRLVEPQMAFKEGQDHRRIREVVQRSFTPKVARTMVDQVGEMVRAMLAQAGPDFDLVTTLAYPLPARVICRMLGVPDEDHPAFIEWGKVLIEYVGRSSVRDEYLERTQAQLGVWADYCGDLAQTQEPGSSVLSDMYAAHREQRLSWDEMLANAMFLLTAGHETTTSLIGNGLLALLRSPDQFDLLRNDPALIPRAVEELLRYDSPLQLTARRTVAPIRLGDYDIPGGSELTIVIGAANRDPRAYPDPHHLDVTRTGPVHLAFASGAHFCVGANLARMEAVQAFGVLTQKFGAIRLDGEPVYNDNPVFRRLDHLPISTSPG